MSYETGFWESTFPLYYDYYRVVREFDDIGPDFKRTETDLQIGDDVGGEESRPSRMCCCTRINAPS